jgi:hypothetical protein
MGATESVDRGGGLANETFAAWWTANNMPSSTATPTPVPPCPPEAMVAGPELASTQRAVRTRHRPLRLTADPPWAAVCAELEATHTPMTVADLARVLARFGFARTDLLITNKSDEQVKVRCACGFRCLHHGLLSTQSKK